LGFGVVWEAWRWGFLACLWHCLAFFYCIERLFCIIQRDVELERQHRGIEESREEELLLKEDYNQFSIGLS
jgi:hypothetical protein